MCLKGLCHFCFKTQDSTTSFTINQVLLNEIVLVTYHALMTDSDLYTAQRLSSTYK